MHFASSKVYTPRAPPRESDVRIQLPKQIPNTNIISIDLGELSQQVKLFTGDPKVCLHCEAIFNSTSAISLEEGKKLWKCEFCDHVNTIDLEEDEIPSKEETLDYMLLPPEEKNLSGEEKIIIFCLDISGSMCVTTEITGNLKVRGDKNPELCKSLNQNAHDQWLPRQRRDVTYISRLQCVQAAIDVQLEKLKKEHPNYKVGLIVFNHEVTILGDGTIPPLVVTGDKLNDYSTLYNIGTSNQVVKPIAHCKEQLVKKLYELDESGATALAEGTSGIIDIVDPEKITDNFSSILESRLVGTSVSVKLFLHSGFQFPEDEEWKKGDGNNTFYVLRNVGNAFEDTEITAEFKLRSLEEISKIFPDEKNPTKKTKNTKKELPFQVQIEYTAPSGMKCLRVITRKKEITTDMSEVIRNVDVALLGMHANLTSAKLAQRGDVLGAIRSAESYGNLIQTNVSTEGERKSFEKWSMVNMDLYSSPQIRAQQKIQEQTPFWNQGSFQPPQPPTDLKRSSSLPHLSSAPQPNTFNFGQPQQAQQNNSSFNFGQSQQAQQNIGGGFNFGQPQQEQQSIGFNFGQPQQAQQNNSGFSFGQPQQAQQNNSGFSFGQPQQAQQNISSFSFRQPQQAQQNIGGFSFGQPQQAQQKKSSFSFGQSQQAQQNISSFNFGQPQDGFGTTSVNGIPQHQSGLNFGSGGSFTSPQTPPRFAFSSNVAEPSLIPTSSPHPQTSNFDPFNMNISPQQSTLPSFQSTQSPGILPQAQSPLSLGYPQSGPQSPQSPGFSSPQSPMPQYDDDTSNQIYQQINVRKNKKIWSEKRKF